MNLHNRIARLERALGTEPCSCPDSADYGWPRHHPDQQCRRCGGERRIYLLPHHPGDAEPLLRQVLPLLHKAYGKGSPDFDSLTNQELLQLRQAFAAAREAEPRRH